ncbi:MFS transporter [Gorillibacterium sp. sgz500922]|uniref:MFS transporter n=1 Tax=Gorillibacterium sp. sgz500922 TaxID=3446694 RepID=UPI003F664B06
MKWNRTTILAFSAIVLGFFMALLDSTIVNIALPEMTRSFSGSVGQISWVVNGYNLAFAVSILTAARLADQFGRKRVFLIGLGLFTLASLFAGLSTSIETLIICRIVQGLAGAIIVPVTVPLATSAFPKEMHGMVIGLWGAISGLAAASGPVLGGILTDRLSWPWIFYVNVPLGVLSIILTFRFIGESFDPTTDKRIDWAGTACISAAMFCFTYALIKIPDYGWSSGTSLLLFGAAAVGLVCFFLAESFGKHPILPLSLLKIKVFDGAAATMIVAGAAIMSIAFLFSFFLTRVRGMSELHAGLTISAMSLASMLGSVLAGPMAAKYGSRWFAAVGMTCMVASLYTFTSLTAESTLFAIIIRLALAGIGLGLTLSPVISSSIRNVPEEKVGIGSGVINMSRAIGNVLGVAILVTMLHSYLTAEMKHAQTDSVTSVEAVTELNPTLKQALVKQLQAVSSDASRDSSSMTAMDPNSLSAQLDEQAALQEKALPQEQQEAFRTAFAEQKKVVLKLVPKLTHRYHQAVETAFHRTFGFSCLLLLVGIPLALGSDVRRPRGSGHPRSLAASGDK